MLSSFRDRKQLLENRDQIATLEVRQISRDLEMELEAQPSWSTVEGGNAMILEAMYNGEFYPCETVVPTSPEYRKAIQTCAALMEQLSHRLSKEDYALVEELRAQNAIAQCEESESHFKYGFSAGLIVQQEAHEQLQNKK